MLRLCTQQPPQPPQPEPAVSVLKVQFPSGELVQVRLRGFRPPDPSVPHGVLAALGGLLSSTEQAEAEAMAVELLEKNENCCLGGWN